MECTPVPLIPPAACGSTAPVNFVHNIKLIVQPTHPFSAAAIPLPRWKFVHGAKDRTLQMGECRHGLFPPTSIAPTRELRPPPQGTCQPSCQGCSQQLLQQTDKVHMYKTLRCPFYLHPFIRIYCNTKKILNSPPPQACLETLLHV